MARRKRPKPPSGILPEYLRVEEYPDPSLEDLLARYQEVRDAVERYRLAGLEPEQGWLAELGIWPPVGPLYGGK